LLIEKNGNAVYFRQLILIVRFESATT